MNVLVICRAVAEGNACECMIRETFHGCDVRYCPTVENGLAIAAASPLDVILIEVELLSGDALAAINAFTNRGVAPPIIALARPDQEDAALHAVGKGIQDYLIKTELSRPLIRHAFRTSLELNRCSEGLRQTEERFRMTFDRAAVGMAHTSPEGKIILANSSFAQLLGYSDTEIRERTISNITHPEDQLAVVNFFDRMVKGELDHYTVEKRYLRKEGSAIWVRVTCSMVFDALRNPSFAIVIAEDITPQKQAEESLRFSEGRFEALFRDNPVMIVTIDGSLTMLTVNPMCARVLEYTVEQLEGISVLDIFHEDDREAVADQLRKCLDNPYNVYSWQFRKLRQSGEIIWVEEVAQAVYDLHGTQNVLVVCQDITERKKAEEALQEALHDLERSNRDLEQFAYLASHDLKEPLRMVLGFMKLLETKYRGQLDEKADTYINLAVDGAKRMDLLIDGLLKYSRIGRSKAFSWVDTGTSLADAIANLDVAIREVRAEVAATSPLPTVWGDDSLLVQLFQNLISNGIKYRRQDAPPRIAVWASRQENQWVFAVKDNGIGIQSGDFERIFQIFQRLHTGRECPGTGIGLASCKRIVEHHHGRIWVESSPGGGSTFFFTIPAGREEVKLP